MPIPRALFVVGSPRSGTTLMAGLLSQLPGVWIGKETGFIPHLYQAGIESAHEWDDRRLADLIGKVNSYLTVQRWDELASVRGARRFWSETGTTGYSGLIRYVWSLDVAPGMGDVEVAGDQSPNYVLAMALLERLVPDALYVNVVRDPRDVVASILPLRFGAQSPGVAASYWNECMAGWLAAERRIEPERRCEVRYEDLVTAPVQTLRRLAAFVGTEPPDLDGVESLTTDVHGLAGLDAHHLRLRDPIDGRSIGRYRLDLSARDRDLVEAITYAGMVTYGYEVGPFRPSPVLEENALLLTGDRLRDLRRRACRSVARRWRR